MKQLVLPEKPCRRLAFYLAMEEWAAHTLPAGDYFFAWRVEPTVICGRNQDIACEVDLDYCRREGIDVVRRKSGGGAVYADMNNFMFSYITAGDEVTSTFSRYTTMIASMLCSLGLEAQATGRNDIVINGAKVAGNAFYHLPGRCIAHGTMLYDFDHSRLMRALTPSRAKLESKAVTSAPMRVTSLTACGLKMNLEEFGRYAVDYLCTDGEICLTADDIAAIEAKEQAYYEQAFFYGRIKIDARRKPDVELRRRIEGVGEFEVAINLNERSAIENLGLWGDFFVVGDLYSDIIEPLRGVDYEPESLKRAIDALQPGKVVAGMTNDDLLNLLT